MKSIKDYGDPRKFLQEVNFIFGENVWQGMLVHSHPAFVHTSGLSVNKDHTFPDYPPFILSRVVPSVSSSEWDLDNLTSCSAPAQILQVIDSSWNKLQGGTTAALMSECICSSQCHGLPVHAIGIEDLRRKATVCDSEILPGLEMTWNRVPRVHLTLKCVGENKCSQIFL